MTRYIRPLLTLGGLLTAACGESTAPLTGLPRELSLAEAKLVESDNRFALKLFREVSQRDTGKNLFISPLSVAMALGMTYNGAAGTTQTAMQQTLELQGLALQQVNESYRSMIDLLRALDARVEFTLANSIWYRQGFSVQPSFLDVNRKYFEPQVEALDFANSAATGTINAWVKDKTRSRIEKIVEPPIDPQTIMFLINAIYFKGDWTHQFQKSSTSPRPFMLRDGSSKSVPTMTRDGKFRVFTGETLQAVDLSYSRGAYSMTILLPRSGADVDALIGGLDQDRWSQVIAGLKDVSQDIFLPKFKLEYALTMNDVLIALGMGVAFSDGQADFRRINPAGGLYISQVKHKAFVDVNEEGTEAAAVTSVEARVVSSPPSTRIDRPFAFVIRERFSGTILFMGKILDPTAAT